jgi:hypothetical protein
MVSKTQDPRDETLIQMHSTLAKMALDQETARVQAILANDPSLAKSVVPPASNAATEYTVAVDFEAALFIHIGINFSQGESTVLEYSGYGGGNIAGIGVLWGTAWLNYDPNTLRRWQARFWANMVPATVNVNLWGMNGEVIGSLVAGGFQLNISTAGGQGPFS